MQLLGISRLEHFVTENEDSRTSIGAWRLEVEEAQWTGPEDIQARYTNAVVQPDHVVFSIKNLCKIGVKAKFKHGILLIEKIWSPNMPKQMRSFAKSAALGSKA